MDKLYISLICNLLCAFFFIFGIAFTLPYILSFEWLHNPQAPPLPYWYALPCFIASAIFLTLSIKVKIEEIEEEEKSTP